MIVPVAFFDAFLMTLGALVSIWLALRQSARTTRTFLLRSLFCIWLVAFGPMLVDSGDWVHLTWSAQVPLMCTFLLSGALLFAIWPEDAAFYSQLSDHRFVRPPPPRVGPAWWFFGMMLSLGVTPVFLLELFGDERGRSIGEPMRRVFELARWGLGGPLPECLEFESSSGDVGSLPREVTVPVSTLLIAAYLWIAFCGIAFLGRAIPWPRVRRGFLLLAPFLVGGFLLELGRSATTPIAWFDPGLLIVPEVRSGVWESDPAVLRSFGPVLLVAMLSAILLAVALSWDRRRARG